MLLSLTDIKQCVCINDVTGHILLCRSQNAALYTLNGELLLEQRACAEGDEVITACTFFEGSGNEFLTRNLVFTGHRHGVVNVSFFTTSHRAIKDPETHTQWQIWDMTIHDGKFTLEHLKRMDHIDTSSFNISSAITAILPTAQAVYTADDDGRVVSSIAIEF